MKLLKPVDAVISQKFGNPAKMYTDLGLLGHNGIDYACKTGTKIKACADGEVTYAGGDILSGIGIVIIHPQFNIKSIYWHLKSFSVKVGDKVKQGQVIALSDNTGRSTGPHLHFAIKPVQLNEAGWLWDNTENTNGYRGAIDPMPYFMPSTYRLGDEGYHVTLIQQILKEKGYKLSVDGKFGLNTQRVVRDFQKKNWLISDGIVGKHTLKVLGIAG